jgi:pyridinium-3,5-biscarboxylic acid mononucleotide sulfurtransferase
MDDKLDSIEPATRARWQRLGELFREMGSAIVAFSGGVDSGLLSVAAYRALGDKFRAITIHSPVDAPDEVETAQALAQQVGFAHQVIELDDLENPMFVANPPDRCYHCKLARLHAIRAIAKQDGFAAVCEGSNADDGTDYRPGRRAVSELGGRSPLAEAGLTKAEIRSIAQALGLLVWDRPSAPCLATRFPYGTEITPEGLRQVGEAEAYLKQLGFSPLRVRHHGAVARLEVAPGQIARLVEQRDAVAARLKQIGYQYVAVDVEGYRSGSLNEVLAK